MISETSTRRTPAERTNSLTTLIVAARGGDQRAWEQLFHRLSPVVRAVVRRCGLDAAAQEDVMQDTWMRLFECIETLREPEALSGWLATTAQRQAWRAVAETRREVLVEEMEIGDRADFDTPDQAVIESERRAAVHRAVEALAGSQRELMRTLLAAPISSYEQVGRSLGMPHGSIGPTRNRSIASLRKDAALRQAVAS